jgi:outer membrane protein assembly factor BamA
LGNHLFADVHATYRNYPQEDFFGTGNDSREGDHTDYRLEDLNYGGRIGVHLSDHIRAGGQLGWIKTHVGTGTDARFPTVSKVFNTDDVAGLEEQPNYLQTGAFVEADYRNEAGNPHGGGRYVANWSRFQDRNLGRYDFNQYDLEAQQYFPFFNQRRVIALRAKTTLTSTADGQEVPFFMQPTVGGSEDLRGYSEFRFRDSNLVVFNAEYRWEAFAGLDLALFADAGQVASAVRNLDLGNFKTATGVGFRFNSAKSVFLRIDVGFSREGGRVFMKFNHVF